MDSAVSPTKHVPESSAAKQVVDIEFAEAVRAGLTASERSLPAVWHYDSLGSTLFEAICLLPEYDLTRIEDAILIENAAAVIAALGPVGEIIELGSGVAKKTVALLDAAGSARANVCFRPIDVSAAALADAEQRLKSVLPNIVCAPIIGDYIGLLRRGLPAADGRRLAVFLGSNIGNYQGGDGLELLRCIHAALAPGDGLLLGAALRRDARELIDAYDDPTGVTAAFNRNVLGRINRELGGNFDLRGFKHEVHYVEETGVVQSYLTATEAQNIAVRALDLKVHFRRGDRIHTESSCKYTVDGIRALGEEAGFAWQAQWVDEHRHFCDALFVK